MTEIFDELNLRVANTQKLLQEANIHAIIVMQDIDLLYYTNSMQVTAAYIPAQGKILTFYKSALEKVKQDCPLELIQAKSTKQLPGLIKEITGNIPETIGFEFDVLPVALYNKILKNFNQEKSITSVDASQIIKSARMIKSPYEIALMKKSAQIADTVFTNIKNIMKPGMREIDVAIEMEYLFRQNSHLGPTRMRNFNHELFFGHVLSGETGLIPASFATPFGGRGAGPAFSSGPSDKKINKNEPVAIDYVSNYYGYHADTTRTFVIGKLSSFLMKQYSALEKVYNKIIEILKPGAMCSGIYTEILDFVEKLELKDNFMGLANERVSFIGHGIGLEIDEFPVISKGFDMEIQENMTIAFEPKMFFSGEGAIGLEDTFLITGGGCEPLSGIETGVITV